MPPKAAKKKKTKAEIEEEQRRLEEEARLAEEERIEQEEDLRRQQEELERQRQCLLEQLHELESNRTRDERLSCEATYTQREQQRKEAYSSQQENRGWDRYLLCTPLPHPSNGVAMNDFLIKLQEAGVASIPTMMHVWQDCASVLDDCYALYHEAVQVHDAKQAAAQMRYIRELHVALESLTSTSTAHFLLYSDEHANERNEVQLAAGSGGVYWAVWINTVKNPRLKVLDFPQVHVQVEVPKQIALAATALKVQHHSDDKYSAASSDGFIALGGVTSVELLALPLPSKKVKHWTLRPVAAQALALQRIPYPIPPAGADPATYRSEEEPPPLRITRPLPPQLLLLPGVPLAVGWWDHASSAWSQQGVSEVVADRGAGSLSFSTTRLGSLALLRSRGCLLPYSAWSVRPTGGLHAATVELTLQTEAAGQIVFEVGPGYAQLQQEVQQQLGSVVGVQMQPLVLLWRLTQLGLPLMPEARDAPLVGVQAKEAAVERAMCEDLATVSRTFLVASSRWNQAAGAGECLCRLSEIEDWEEGGRTELHHVQRIFVKEREEGSSRVLVVMRRGDRGLAFSDAMNKRPEYVPAPSVATVDDVQVAMQSAFGEVHHDILSLLGGASAPQAAASTAEGDAAVIERSPTESTELRQRLRASADAVEMARNTNALTTQALAQLLYGLKVFSCG